MEREEIRRELSSLLQSELSQVGVMRLRASHSDWSAHGDWSSSKVKLAGKLSLSTHIGEAKPEQLEKIIADGSSTRLLEVARSLQEMIGEEAT